MKKLLREIQEEFGLHDLAIEDAHDAHQRPKIEQYGNCLFVVLRTAHLAGESQHVEFERRTSCWAALRRFCPTWLTAVARRFAHTLRGFTAAARQRSWLCPLRIDGFCSRPVFPHPRGVGRESG